jgi:hypothetical protein
LFRIRSNGEKVVLDNVRFLSHEGPRVAGRRQKETRAGQEKRSEAITAQETKRSKHKSRPHKTRRTATRLALVDASLAV